MPWAPAAWGWGDPRANLCVPFAGTDVSHHPRQLRGAGTHSGAEAGGLAGFAPHIREEGATQPLREEPVTERNRK